MPRLFVNRLTVIDSAYLDPKLGLVGISWILDLELEGELTQEGMILDFGLIKKEAKATIEARYDHCLLVPKRHPGCRISRVGDSLEVCFTYGEPGRQRQILHRSPAEGVSLIDLEAITPASLAECMGQELFATMPANVSNLHIRLREEEITGASYSYSHGLKQHQGKCRRIAHGHRSRLDIWRNGEPAPAIEAAWAQDWQNIYLANAQDLLFAGDIQGQPSLRFGYGTAVGDFLLELPQERCALLSGDTTVEHIAQHIADHLAKDYPGDDFLVQAYEGLDKGAVARSGPSAPDQAGYYSLK